MVASAAAVTTTATRKSLTVHGDTSSVVKPPAQERFSVMIRAGGRFVPAPMGSNRNASRIQEMRRSAIIITPPRSCARSGTPLNDDPSPGQVRPSPDGIKPDARAWLVLHDHPPAQ